MPFKFLSNLHKNALPAYTRSLKVFVGIYYTTHPLGQPIREVELPEIKRYLNSYIRFSIPFLGVDDLSWILFAAFAPLFEGDGS